ncbi:Phosphoglycolate phosphatase 1B, chloroplastic [Zea mays]|uniref:Phosphoglycolate phosphatase 1B, chloroplastic n=1 Tax=Zea mays TaxID=4577 RepID=A0A3L6DMD9_MAIZE|nr:Phosphoglycolate phosphatase 1B, chloroplastic [Zea mays]
MRVHNRIMAFSVMEIRRAMLRLRWWLTTLDEVVKHVLLCQGDPLDHTRAAAAGTQAEVYVIREEGILKELELIEFQYLGGPILSACLTDGDKKIELKPGFYMEHDEDVWDTMQQFGITTSQICMMGDWLVIDILFGQNGGCKTLLVLQGSYQFLNSNSDKGTTDLTSA